MPSYVQNLEQLIQDFAQTMSARMLEIARDSRSEEDVRHWCNTLIDSFLQKASINVVGRHEYGLKGGRIDSKYGGVILEYKDPRGVGRITQDPNAPGTRAVVKQIEDRFRDFETMEHIAPERLIGVGLDGDSLIFVRYRAGSFDVSDPQPANRYTVERLLRALVSLGAHGYSFTPERLTESFAGDSVLAQRGINTIYQVICETTNIKASTFFKQWRILFSEVCGFDVEGKNDKIGKLGEHYRVANAKPAELLFSVHTYYAIVIKLLAAEIASSFSPIGVSVLKRCVDAPTTLKLLTEMRSLEQGGIWSQIGITNFLEGDIFAWYLAAWDERMATVVRGIVEELDKYDPATLSVDPAESRDLIKKLYQQLFPRSVRHDLGEYYTPDWLAEHVLNELGYDGNPDTRILDPACGSGTFLVMAINRIRRWFEEHRDQCGFGERDLISKILRNVVGFDLNPLAVMAARTNYLLAIRDLLKYASSVELPIYLCDSIMTPATYGDLFVPDYERVKKLKTSAGEFLIPLEVATSREQIGKYADTLETCVRNKYAADEFLALCREDGLPVSDEELHRTLYEQLRALDLSNQNGIWARIIKNAFAPLFTQKVDYVIGNPPWVNWESLPGDYRSEMKPLWQSYGLFTLSASAGRMGGGKKDLSMLFVYACIDHYLVQGGSLAFVITQTVFKTKGAGDGFRRFRFISHFQRQDSIKRISDVTKERETIVIQPNVVHDLSELKVFEGATNRTAVLISRKSTEDFSYPVPYILWKKRDKAVISQDLPLAEVMRITCRQVLAAEPVSPTNLNTPWLTALPGSLPALRKVAGQSEYKAYAGSCTWLNGVFWVRVLAKLHTGHLLIENLNNVGDTELKRIERVIEPDLVYPLLRGRDVNAWHAEPSSHIIVSQDPETKAGIPESEMMQKYRKTYEYLKEFETELRKRSGFRKYFQPIDPFYSIYNVGPYTLAHWKVVWRDMGSKIQVAVAGNYEDRPICPDHHVMEVSVSDEDEAHYLCGVLMSSPAQLVVSSYTTTTGISTHVLENVSIPRYSPANPLHKRISQVSKYCQKAAAEDNDTMLRDREAALDRLASQLWGITDEELLAVQAGIMQADECSDHVNTKSADIESQDLED